MLPDVDIGLYPERSLSELADGPGGTPMEKSVKTPYANDLLLNLLTLWIKFYMYVSFCTDIGYGFLGYSRGIVTGRTTVPQVVLIESGADLRGLVAEIVEGVVPAEGTVWVPTLKAVVEFITFWYGVMQTDDQRGDHPTWTEFASSIHAASDVPWGRIQLAEEIPDKEIPSIKFLHTKGVKDTLILLKGQGDDDLDRARYHRRCDRFKVMRAYAGHWEANVFKSFMEADETTAVPALYIAKPDGTYENWLGATDPKVDFGQQLSIVYTGGNHYKAMLPAWSGRRPDVNDFLEDPRNDTAVIRAVAQDYLRIERRKAAARILQRQKFADELLATDEAVNVEIGIDKRRKAIERLEVMTRDMALNLPSSNKYY